MKKCYLLTAFVLLVTLCTRASTFVVTSNADNGPNTLRQAILAAAANGTSTPDLIVFQLPDLSRTGRTIILLSELPALTSYLVIDGSSQPGTNIGVSDAKVILQRTAPVDAAGFIFLQFENVTNIEIYGLYLFNKWWESNIFSPAAISGIVFSAAKNIIIGGIGRGNYIRGTKTAAISSQSVNEQYYSDSVYVQCNIIGNDETGGITNAAPISETIFTSGYGISFRNVYNVWIGGDNVQEGNTMFCGRHDIFIDKVSGCGLLKIVNNKFNVDINGNLDLDGSSGNESGFAVSGNSSKSDLTLKYIDNILNGNLSVYRLSHPFTIQGNKIFGWQFLGSVQVKLNIASCNGGIVGGDLPGQQNEIGTSNSNTNYYGVSTPEDQSAIANYNSPNVTIKKNSIYCTSYFGSSIKHSYYNPGIFPVPYVRIDSTGVNYVRGKATPNSTIEVFLDDDCVACEGKTYLGSTTSNTDSTWNFAGTFNTVVVATATNSEGSTSEFSAPELITNSITTRNPSCGKKNGYIKGMQAKGYDRVEWRHRYNPPSTVDSVVSNQLDAFNLAPGQYYFHAWLGNSCRSYFWRVDVGPDITPRLDTSAKQIVQPACGQNTGSIKNIKVTGSDYSNIYWKNSNGQIFPPTITGQFANLINAAAGTYKLVVEDPFGGCGDSTFWYTLNIPIGTYLDTDNIQITNATCSNSNGSISNIVVHNAIAPLYYRWEDSTGAVVGNSLNLNNIKGGKYKLKFKDGGTCDTIRTSFFIVQAVGLITIDSSNKKITSSCTQSGNGSITGLSAIGANSYQWMNTGTSTVVGNAIDLQQVPIGTYQLQASNTVTGCSATSSIFSVLDNVFPAPLGFTSFTIKPATCNLDNGYLLTTPTPITAQFAVEWIDSATGSFYSNSNNISNLAAGTYEYYVINTNGCKKMVSKSRIVQTGNPSIIDASTISINDTCNAGLGQISLEITGIGIPYRWDLYNNVGTLVNNIISLSSTVKIDSLKSGTYYAIAKDGWNCSDTSQIITVGNSNKTISKPVADSGFIPRGAVATILVKNHQSYQWHNYTLYDTLPATNAIQANNTSGMFTTYPIWYNKTFYLQNTQGTCSSSLTPVFIGVYDKSNIIVPNAFSPNGDGINDVWKITVEGVISLDNLSVYNRNGSAVFSTRNMNEYWDGKKNGNALPIGTYYWIISAKDNYDKLPIKRNGYVVIMR